jgi:hypothetical protein
MTYRGHVKQGVIVLVPPAQLPEGTEVEVLAPQYKAGHATWPASECEDDQALVSGSIAGAAQLLAPEDFSDWEN